MPTNRYFNNTQSLVEQRLIEDLWVESIQITGTDAFYIIRNDENTDFIYGEDPLKTFTSNFPIEIYNSDTTDFEGMKELFSKFGEEIHNDYTILLSRKTFKQRVKQNPLYDRPREGDLVFIPHVSRGGTLFEITWIEPDADFFTLGRKLPYYYKMKLEPFKYSNEVLQTGILEVDTISGEAYNIELQLSDGIGDYIMGEYVFQGSDFVSSTQKAIVYNWDTNASVLSVTNTIGLFTVGQPIIGESSDSVYTLVSFDPMQNNTVREAFNNELITNEGVSYIDDSETNPLSI